MEGNIDLMKIVEYLVLGKNSCKLEIDDTSILD